MKEMHAINGELNQSAPVSEDNVIHEDMPVNVNAIEIIQERVASSFSCRSEDSEGFLMRIVAARASDHDAGKQAGDIGMLEKVSSANDFMGQGIEERTTSLSSYHSDSDDSEGYLMRIVAARASDRAAREHVKDNDELEKVSTNDLMEQGRLGSTQKKADENPPDNGVLPEKLDTGHGNDQDVSTMDICKMKLREARIMGYVEDSPFLNGEQAPMMAMRAEEVLVQSKRPLGVLYDDGSANANNPATDESQAEDADSHPCQLQANGNGPSFNMLRAAQRRAIHRQSLPGAYANGPSRFMQRADQIPYVDSHGDEDQVQDNGIVEAQIVVDDDGNELMEAQPVDLNAQDDRKRKGERVWSRIGLCMFFLLATILFICGIVVWLAIRSQRSSSIVPSELPSTSTSQAPSAAPSWAVDAIFQDLPSDTIERIRNPLSPQGKAFEWLTTHQNISSMENWRKKQLLALVSIYFSFNGPEWPFGLNEDWLDDSRHECYWFSTLFGDFGGKVVEGYEESSTQDSPCNEKGEYRAFVMGGVGVGSKYSFIIQSSSMPPEIALLTSLERFELNYQDFRNMSLAGMIPTELLQMTKLRSLHLSLSQLTGTIPHHLWQMTNLELLDFTNNDLTGSLSTEIGLLQNLRFFNVSFNSLTGTIPTELDTLSELQELVLSVCSFTGQIPTGLGNLKNMTYMSLLGNSLTGQIPSELGHQTALEVLSLRNNLLTGPVPINLFSLTRSQLFYLQTNFLTGTIPTEIGLLTSVRYLWLGQNSWTGSIPSEIGLLSNLVNLDLAATTLTGNIPSEIGDLATQNLKDFNIQNSTLSGTAPSELCELNQLCLYATYHIQFVMCQFAFNCSETLCGCECECAP